MKRSWCVGRVLLIVELAIIIPMMVFLVVFSVRNEGAVVVPEMEIILGNTTLNEINAGSKKITYAGNEMILTDNGDKYVFDNVEIRGRGNASWLMDKKSYRIKIPQKTNLLGLGKLRKWGLISNNIDNTLMRNDLGHYVASILYDEYPIHGEFVKLRIDDRDLGLYYIIKLVGIGKNNVDLKNPGGILVEVDNVYCGDSEMHVLTRNMLDCVSVDGVVVEDLAEEVFSEFMEDYNNFEVAVKRGKFEKVVEKIDVESWVKYYLLSEFSSNPDAYVTSWYLHKDGDNDKIHVSVGWDFDAAFGNKNWGGDSWLEGFYSPTELMTRMKYSVNGWNDYEENEVDRCKLLEGDSLISPTMCYMMAMSEFRELAGKIYRERLMNEREEVISYIREKADYIRDAAIANNELWGRGDFDEAVEYLIWWVDKRFDFFDDLYGKMELFPEES